MKLYYNKNSRDPIYYAQQSIRQGEKTTTRNIKRIGKHSELLKISDDPLEYAKSVIKEMNEEYRVGMAEFTQTFNLNDAADDTDAAASPSTAANIGYMFLQYIMKDLCLKDFFREKIKDSNVASDCYNINRFLVYSRILNSCSGSGNSKNPNNFYEQPVFNYQQILKYMDLLGENSGDYLVWLHNKSNNIVKRNTAANPEDPAKDILEISGKRCKTEECFRMIKSVSAARPVFHMPENQTRAHILICYTALLVYRLLNAELDNQGTHFKVKDVVGTLNNLNITNDSDMLHKSIFRQGDVLRALIRLTLLPLNKRYYRTKDLNSVIRNLLT